MRKWVTLNLLIDMLLIFLLGMVSMTLAYGLFDIFKISMNDKVLSISGLKMLIAMFMNGLILSGFIRVFK